MCFLEFIGYTCGHISLPVLRPCPMTTASHTFPTCPRRADKPFLAGEMCPSCQKIIHSRATQIEEYEHRFMHERGVCGCETVFPYLIRPRIIGGGDAVNEGSIDVGADDQGVLPLAGTNDNGANDTQVPPLLYEAMGTGGRAVVSVRLPSLYAAEWVADHRDRHIAGLCHCRIDFSTYHQAMQDAENELSSSEENQEGFEDDLFAPTLHPLRRVLSLPAMPIRGDPEAPNDSRNGHQRSSSHHAFSYFMGETDYDGITVITSPTQSISHSPALGPSRDGGGVDRGGPGLGTRQALPPPGTRPWGYKPTPIQAGKAVRFSGAVFAQVPGYLPLTGPFLVRPSPYSQGLDQPPVLDGMLDVDVKRRKNYPGNGESSSPMALPFREVTTPHAHAQSVANLKEHHIRQASESDPLVGFPIGAGPEGVLHSIPWHDQPPCWRQL